MICLTKFENSPNITSSYRSIFYCNYFSHQVFPKGSPLADDFSHAILQLSENGALKQLENKWFSLSFTSCPSSDMTRDTDRLGLESFWALFLFTGVASTSVLFIFKARLFPRYGHRTHTRMKLWGSKHFRSMKVRQISRRHSTSLKRTAPEPAADDLPVVLEHHNELGNLPEKNNV